ncbi:hypothetical protein ABUW04_10095 [Streptacidiphilus sp. N1-10]|uniref:Uncharacterized protein n=1 Tax=Streptacidiphilus jeojiensis TaxID=3229225 RepID=A0ABV6XKR1_9ACTN
MTITTGTLPKPGTQPRSGTSLTLARGLVTGGVIGTSLAALVVGAVVNSGPLFGTGSGLAAGYGLLCFLGVRRQRDREAAVAPRTALAMIESMDATTGEPSDVPVRFDLSVVPDDAPGFRVEITQDINRVDLPDYRPRGVLVVQYPPDRPWRARIVKRPTPEWEDRVAGARLDTVPGPAVARESQEGCSFGLVALVGLLLGAAAVVLLFRADLFAQDTAARPPSGAQPSVSVSSTWSSTVETSASGTVTLGPGQSFLDRGELRRAVDSLTKGRGTRQALTVVVQDRLLSIVFTPTPTGTQALQFDPGSLPYERFPALVQEAVTTLGVHSPQTWQLSVDRLTSSLTIRIGVTGPGGSASLEADGQGRVVRRSPVG